jgi:hypothetical protein
MMEWLTPALLAFLFILFGLSRRGRTQGGCGACTEPGLCQGKAHRDCKKAESSMRP